MHPRYVFVNAVLTLTTCDALCEDSIKERTCDSPLSPSVCGDFTCQHNIMFTDHRYCICSNDCMLPVFRSTHLHKMSLLALQPPSTSQSDGPGGNMCMPCFNRFFFPANTN
uniref:Putative secreted protein n=1 Tax=Amblyomma cajennense TaxID=34607 RepID=A0A023FBS9_AMBCJ